MLGARLVRKYGNPSVRENVVLGLYDRAYVHFSMYANVRRFLAGTS